MIGAACCEWCGYGGERLRRIQTVDTGRVLAQVRLCGRCATALLDATGIAAVNARKQVEEAEEVAGAV